MVAQVLAAIILLPLPIVSSSHNLMSMVHLIYLAIWQTMEQKAVIATIKTHIAWLLKLALQQQITEWTFHNTIQTTMEY